MQRGHQERLPALAAEAFLQTDIQPRDLTHIGVTLGPGSFTGLRVGLSFAKGLAVGLGLPLQGIGTLEALGYHPHLLDRRRAAVIDGGRGQIYVQELSTTGHKAPRAVSAVDAIDADILTGPGAHLLGGDIFEQAWPTLDTLLTRTLAGGHDDLTPLYMRDADAIASKRGIITLIS